MAGKKRTRKNSLASKSNTKRRAIVGEVAAPIPADDAPNGIDIVARIGRDPVYQIITHLSDTDLIAFCEAHPNHYRAANVVATFRLLQYMSLEALREHCHQKNFTSIDALRYATQYCINALNPFFPDGINPQIIPDDVKELLIQVAGEGILLKQDQMAPICASDLTNLRKIALQTLAPYLIAHGHINFLKHPLMEEKRPLILKAAYIIASNLRHDKVLVKLMKSHDIPRFSLPHALQALTHGDFSSVALLALDGLIGSSTYDLLDLYDAESDELYHASKKIFNHLRRYIIELEDLLPVESFPGEHLMSFAIQLGCFEEADELASFVESQYVNDVNSLYLSTFVQACQHDNDKLAEKLLPRIAVILSEMALSDHAYLSVYMNSLMHLRIPKLQAIAIRLARQINALDILLLTAVDRGDDSITKLLLTKYCQNIPAHIIEKSIYRAINQSPYLARKLLNTIFSFVTQHISPVAFDEFIEYAGDPLVEKFLERVKSTKNNADAIAHIYTPALQGKRKKIRDSEVKELQSEAGALFKRKRH